jgi:NAD(P)-dependent dehydrogenase (short-subunit alcohol dehydrogenase family)
MSQLSVATIKDLTDEHIETTYGVNLFAMFAPSRDAVARLGPGSCIINTTSVQAYSPSGHLLDYAATKATINAFTKGLAKQLGQHGIRVNAIAPGPIWTPLQPSGGQPAEALPTFGHDTWLGRAVQPAELAAPSFSLRRTVRPT